MTDRNGIVIMTRRQPLLVLYVNELVKQFPGEVRQVIYEHQGPRRVSRLISGRVKRLGLPPVLGQLMYLAWDKVYVRPASTARVAEEVKDYSTAMPGPELPQLDVALHNGPETVQALQALQPAVVVLVGAAIVRPHILEQAPIFLNIHSGITPRYRGAHGAFWAVWEGRPELSGSTVHQVDKGIDTGPIVSQVYIPIRPDDTPRTLVARQIAASVPPLVAAVGRALAGELTTFRRDDLESRLWYPPTMLDYLQFHQRLARQHRAGKLPTAFRLQTS